MEIVECIEPTTKRGVCNVSFCDRTYAPISELKLLASALEIYREEITSNLEEILEPVVATVNTFVANVNSNTTQLASVETFVNSFQELNISTRITSLESRIVSKEGGTIDGVLSFSETGSIDMSDRPIVNLPAPVKDRDATRKIYVDNLVNPLKARVEELETGIADIDDLVNPLEARVGELEAGGADVDDLISPLEARVGELEDRVLLLEDLFLLDNA